MPAAIVAYFLRLANKSPNLEDGSELILEQSGGPDQGKNSIWASLHVVAAMMV